MWKYTLGILEPLFRNLCSNLFHLLGYNDKGCYHSSVKSNVAVQAALQNQMNFECLKLPILFTLKNKLLKIMQKLN